MESENIKRICSGKWPYPLNYNWQKVLYNDSSFYQLQYASIKVISFENFKWPQHWQITDSQCIWHKTLRVRYLLVLAAARRGHTGQTQHRAPSLPWQKDGCKTQTIEENDALSGPFYSFSVEALSGETIPKWGTQEISPVCLMEIIQAQRDMSGTSCS